MKGFSEEESGRGGRDGRSRNPDNGVEWPEAWGSLSLLGGPSSCVPCPVNPPVFSSSLAGSLRAPRTGFKPHFQLCCRPGCGPSSPEPWWDEAALPPSGGVASWLRRAWQPWVGVFLPPQCPRPEPSSPDPRSPCGYTRCFRRLLMTQSEFPGGHWLTHSDMVETGAQIKEGATGISHTRKRAANENRTPALAASPPEAPGSGGVARMQASGWASGVLSVSTPTRT